MCHSAICVTSPLSKNHCANSCTCKVCQYWLMSKSCCTYAMRAWQMMTSSGLVLLCSFWCHSSIIPPCKYHITHHKNYISDLFAHLRTGLSSMSLQAVITMLLCLAFRAQNQPLNFVLALGLCKQCKVWVAADCTVKGE